MPLSAFAIATILAAFAITLTVVLALLLALPLLDFFKNTAETARVSKAAQTLLKVDDLIAKNRYKDALRQLRSCFILDKTSSPRVVEAVKEHNQNLLSKCLIVAEEMGRRAENIAEVEALLLARSELQELYFKVNSSYYSLKSRRDEAGKRIPSWSQRDFENRISEVKSELEENEELLKEALDLLFDSLAEESKDSIVYH